MTRRRFLGTAAVAGGLLLPRGSALGYAANEQLQIAVVGVAGRGAGFVAEEGWSSVRQQTGGRIVALCGPGRAPRWVAVKPGLARMHQEARRLAELTVEKQRSTQTDIQGGYNDRVVEHVWAGTLGDSSKPDAQVLKSRISRVAVRITAKRFCRIAQGCEATLGSVEGFPPLPQRGCVTDGPAATEPRWGTGSMPRHIPG